VIAAMKHRCCSSEDADVAKIDFMYFCNIGLSNRGDWSVSFLREIRMNQWLAMIVHGIES
jgi:hypothetical protein